MKINGKIKVNTNVDECLSKLEKYYKGPKYVYHYTSIETLASILDSGKIRFTRLDYLNGFYSTNAISPM